MRKRRDTNSPDGAPAAYADPPSLAHAPAPSYTLPWWAAPRWVGMQLFACVGHAPALLSRATVDAIAMPTSNWRMEMALRLALLMLSWENELAKDKAESGRR